MTTFGLLHSSGQGPEGWRLVREALEARGHRVVTPAFRLEEKDKGAQWHAQTIVEALRDQRCDPADTVCVGHSAAGIFLPVVAQLWVPRRMVFLAALIPRPGVSILDQFRADPSMFQPEWIGKNPANDDVALQFLYHDCPPGDRAINPAWQRKASREWLGVDPIELPGGHCPNVGRPEDLAEALVRFSS